jgi:sarcosine oxidase subunit alpha
MSAGPFRLDRGGHIDRQRPLHFTFDDRALTGFEGDTVASALLGAGVSVVGRSMKFHRQRGILSAGIEEPNALLTLGTGARCEPSARATMKPLFDGLVARSQNCWPSLGWDIGRLPDVLHPLFPAGFYNKTFIWPSWHAFEPLIRRIAGLGVAPEHSDPDRYEWRNAHCDVLVVGGGAAGMLAAFLAGRSGARVILVESGAALGGGLNWQRNGFAASTNACEPTDRADGGEAPHVAKAARELAATPGVRVLLHTTAVGAYDHGVVTAVEDSSAQRGPSSARYRERWWRIRAKRVVLASGAFEQPLAFPFNDRPGIMLADAARHYLNRYAVPIGRRVAVATNNDSAYRVTLDLRATGITVPCLLDTRTNPPEDLVHEVRSAGVEVHAAARILGTRGDSRVTSLRFVSDAGERASSATHIECDALAMSGGWNPVAHLYCQAGGRLRFDAHHACLVPDGRLETIHPIGAAAGDFEMPAALQRTHATVAAVLESLGLRIRPDTLWPEPTSELTRTKTGALGYCERAHPERTWLDFQHDVTVSDVDLAVRENLVSVEHVKRYTTAGMAIDQGKTSNLNTLAVLAERTQRTIPEVGTTTFRPMFAPVTLGAIAGGRNGRFYRPKRLLPAHPQHEQLGAHFEDYGGWQRPACYPRAGESHLAAIHREVRAVRAGVGLFDASPLGKFLVRGPDALRFLDRMYANSIESLEAGSVRYGLMLNEQGIVIDDGVCARLASDEFWVNTTGAGAARSGAWFEEWLQGEWPDLHVVVINLTSGWATLNLAGPRAREVLAALPCDIDLGREAFPHMRVRVGTLCGVPCRILRVTFSGELSYEISVPANFGSALWEQLRTAGEPFGITPFGVEALLLMRTEKGYLHVGADTDGTTVPDDIGFGRTISRKPGDFVGRRSLTLPENMRKDRLQLVGLRCIGEPHAFIAGAHLLDSPAAKLPQSTAGYLTSATFSPTLGTHVGLGLLRSGRARVGQIVHIFDSGKQSQAEVVNPSHYDPAGERLHG